MSLSYSSAALRLHNGSMIDIGKVKHNSEQVEMMARLTESSGSEYSSLSSNYNQQQDAREALCGPSTTNIADMFCSLFPRTYGCVRRHDAACIAKVLESLQEKAHTKTDVSPTRAIISTPLLPGLDQALISETASLASLSVLSTHYHIGGVTQITAGYAGAGLGLCEHYTDINKCEAEMYRPPVQFVLAVGFEYGALRVVYHWMEHAYDSLEDASNTRFDLGLSSLPAVPRDFHSDDHEPDTPERRHYWDKVVRAIVDVGRRSPRRITQLVLMGNAADHSGFRIAMKDAMHALLVSNGGSMGMLHGTAAAIDRVESYHPPLLDGTAVAAFGRKHENGGYDPAMVAARGAAEFAKRAQEAPPRCKEPDYCLEKRRRLKSFDACLTGSRLNASVSTERPLIPLSTKTSNSQAIPTKPNLISSEAHISQTTSSTTERGGPAPYTLDSSAPRQYPTPTPAIMAGKKNAGENTKKVAGNAKKAEAAAQKQAAEDAKKGKVEEEQWSKGAKTNAKKDAAAEKAAEAERKKAEKAALLAAEEAAQPSKPKASSQSKGAQKKSKGTLDLSQLEGGEDPEKKKGASLSATGIDNALDALSLTNSTGKNDKIEMHPERRFKAAYAAFEERRLEEMKDEKGLRRQQKVEQIRKEFEKSPDNPFNQGLVGKFDMSKDEKAEMREKERETRETRLAGQR
ncbi:MAG: hypothetical protein M1831_001899 [Alyxoria varia]|nr:MAG: hypothetical protein M1831_001899 [Alyxoria varia]